MPNIHLPDWPNAIPVGRQSILDAALDAGVPFPHGCRSGECGGCKCTLVQGEVRRAACSPDALSAEEQAQGFILACRSHPITDVHVQWLASPAASPTRTLQATVADVRHVTHDVVLLTLALPDGDALNFLPGQYAQLQFGRLPWRNYSMANQPNSHELTFHVRVVPDGRVSNHVATQTQRGDRVTVQAPMGHAVWDAPSDAPLLLLAGGTGLAPMLSVLDAALLDGQSPDSIHLFHGARSAADLYALDSLTQRSTSQGFKFTTACALASDVGVPGQHLHEALAEHVQDFSQAKIYVAGPPPMVDAVKALALKRGAAAHHVHADAFYAAPPSKPSLWQRITGAMPLGPS
jgi:naphthalene 1,2-dioxygenase ferredoxin reductase component